MGRRENDTYFTPMWATEQLLQHVRLRGTVVEPCVGEHAIAHVIRRRHVGKVITNDLVPTRSADLHEDAAHFLLWQQLEARGGADWVVTNPPFIVAFEILKYAVAHARRGVAMLLRLSIVEPTDDRGGWLEEHPPTRMIVLPRISFTGDGATDSVTTAWFIWERGARGTLSIVAKASLHGGREISLWEAPA